MRILYSHRIQSRDGQGVHIEELVGAFRKKGHEVLLVGPSLYAGAAFGGESALVHRVRRILPGWCAELAEILYNLISFRRLRQAHKSFAPDLIYERYNLYHLAGALYRRWYKTRLYIEVNSPLAAERIQYGGLQCRRLARYLEGFTWRSADRIFVVSTVLKQLVAKAGVSEDRIIITPNGVDLSVFPAGPRRLRSGSSVIVGFIGFIRDWHGLGELIAGLGAGSNNVALQLVVAGDGPARPALEQQAAALGVANQVTFIGLQQRENIAELICSFDIAVQPQAVAYASPLKLFEYMACGRAIVAPDQPNIREILDHGESALLFNPNEPDAMWRAIRQLAAEPELRERLGHAARRTLEEGDYTWDGNVTRIIAETVNEPSYGDAAN